ncbi:hypothetical protein TVAG_050430 [Trichomonas vaginalis G3]|uniref:Calcineurin-like phosphoesterase domain-containing protein n=1 Tax=Trichomonas vaginalis (strain ATCC PRA-98 / G3) TaxID=412133 RepID=A2EJH0_TRIV3|nr:hypothetical protein TVAGG3_0389810 [Trichomonas vaginalis G3]EAY07227.1 hypothetical protein TVAG_050430 [Trichomonas vaginalis G3]KAI5533915.1 hypothetical protein TVAGG3_0389810 [Trichomonas vaginalis G3]|eukprot:XP_001319450.1 hypothetical protein [Trichomonas vaginalis G3]
MSKPLFNLKSTASVLQRNVTRRNITLNGTNILMIGKPQIGKSREFEQNLQTFNECLASLIEKTNPTDVFIMGNILDSQITEKEKYITIFLDSLLSYTCKIHVISGDEERLPICSYTNTQIDIIKEHVGILTINQESKVFKLYITDCAGNAYNVSEDSGLRFTLFLQEHLNRAIGQFSFLISSYVEPSFIDFYNRVASVGTFNFHENKIEYLLFDTKSFEISIHSDLDTAEYTEIKPETKKEKCLLI